MPYDIEYFERCVFGKLFNFRKTSETPVKSILYGNSLFPCKECFWEENHLKNHFWEMQSVFGNILGKHNAFGKCYPFWGIAKYQEVLLCAGKVTKEDVKRKA